MIAGQCREGGEEVVAVQCSHSTFFSPGSGLGSVNCNVLSSRAAALDTALARPPPAEEVMESNSSFLLLFIGF